VEQVKGKRPPERYGHTTTFYKGNMIIVAGEHKYNAEIRMRESFCDVWSFNP